VVTVISIAIAGAKFATLPGDELSLTQAFGYGIWMVLMALAAGSVAFALGSFVGRGAAAGIAGFITIAGFIVSGYSAPVPQLAPIAQLTWFGWTINHLPLAGQFDWPSVVFLAIFVRGHAGHRPARLQASRHRRHQYGPNALVTARPGWPERSGDALDRP